MRQIVGRRHVLTRQAATRRYRSAYRGGSGDAVAVVRPGSLVEQWHVLCAVISADAIVIMQAANTGLTGGSTPDGTYDRPVVIISTGRIGGVRLIEDGRQVICFPGTTLYELEAALKPYGREPHSVIGSSCIGASVIGGICNNSGGALVRRGPAYTELALYAQVGSDQVVRLVNHLGIELGDDVPQLLERLERGDFAPADIRHDPARVASDQEYERHVRQVDATTPARFNADPRRLFGASGSAGKLAVFAVRLDTFVTEVATTVFYIGTSDPGTLATLRRHMLTTFDRLPLAAEYIHREAFDLASVYGADTVFAIRHLGTARLPMLFAWKDRLDRLIGSGFSDRLLQRIARTLPTYLPTRILDFRNRYEHHLLLKVDDAMVAQTRDYLATIFPSASGGSFECTPHEAQIAFLHRFAVAGAAVRFCQVHHLRTTELLAFDIALPRSIEQWFDILPAKLRGVFQHRLYYGHFFCHVMHHDYILHRGVDAAWVRQVLHDVIDRRGAMCPAEHNVGTTYPATPPQRAFYQSLDPLNAMNPGIGHASKSKHWTAESSRRDSFVD